MPRPIEMNAHDPRRYLGDMLAWVHQALASERELLISLFGEDNQRRTTGSHADTPSDVPSSSALLDKVLEGVCRPLKVSIHALIFAFSLPCLFLRHQHASLKHAAVQGHVDNNRKSILAIARDKCRQHLSGFCKTA